MKRWQRGRGSHMNTCIMWAHRKVIAKEKRVLHCAWDKQAHLRKSFSPPCDLLIYHHSSLSQGTGRACCWRPGVPGAGCLDDSWLSFRNTMKCRWKGDRRKEPEGECFKCHSSVTKEGPDDSSAMEWQQATQVLADARLACALPKGQSADTVADGSLQQVSGTRGLGAEQLWPLCHWEACWGQGVQSRSDPLSPIFLRVVNGTWI